MFRNTTYPDGLLLFDAFHDINRLLHYGVGVLCSNIFNVDASLRASYQYRTLVGENRQNIQILFWTRQ